MALGQFGLTTNGASSDLTITANATTNCTPITGLTGMLACTVALRFAYGAGGGVGAVKAYVQTSIDGGNTFVDIACVVFGAASETVLLNFSGLTPKITQITPTDGSLPDDTAIDGILGDRLRVKVISSGTVYSGNTLLAGRVVAR